jgi:imidazolonepropionase-like amidohydrolase
MPPLLPRSLSALLLLAALGASAADAPPAPPRTAWIGATVFDGTGAPARPDAVVLTRGGRIEAVLPAAAFRPASDMAVVDLHGRFVIPGLVNTHVHLATSARPEPARAYLQREIYSGVTAVRDMAGDARLLAELQREAEFGEIASPDIFYAALMAGPEFFVDPRTEQASRGRVAGQAPWLQAVTADTDLRLAVARARGTGASAIKIYADVAPALLAAVTREAHAQGLRVWAHATVFPSRPSDAVDAGVDVVSHACMLGYEANESLPQVVPHPTIPVDVARLAAHGDRVDAVLARMKARGTILDATLLVYSIDDSGIDCSYALAARLAGRAHAAGVEVSAGTDDEPGDVAGPWSGLLREIALLHDDAGLSNADVLRAATAVGARAIGRERDMGTLEAGKLANFVVLEKDPLADIGALRSVSATVKAGVAYPRDAYRPPGPAQP